MRTMKPLEAGAKPLPRFLTHMVVIGYTTQIDLGRKIAEIGSRSSHSTISRWFRGLADPNQDDLKLIADATGIPFQTLEFLNIMGKEKNLEADWSYCYPMLADSCSGHLLVTGLTGAMTATYVLCEMKVSLTCKSLTMILDDPVLVLNSETDEEERKADKAIWASATANFRQLSIRNPNVRSKLWVSHKKTNGVLANDLIALIRQPDGSQHLGFRGDTTWKTAIEPIEGLTEGEEGYELIFDSIWGVGDERLGRLLNRILMIHKGV